MKTHLFTARAELQEEDGDTNLSIRISHPQIKGLWCSKEINEAFTDAEEEIREILHDLALTVILKTETEVAARKIVAKESCA